MPASIHIKALAFPLKDKNNNGHFAITLIKTNCSFLSLYFVFWLELNARFNRGMWEMHL
jgi:hypothetical protein